MENHFPRKICPTIPNSHWARYEHDSDSEAILFKNSLCLVEFASARSQVTSLKHELDVFKKSAQVCDVSLRLFPSFIALRQSRIRDLQQLPKWKRSRRATHWRLDDVKALENCMTRNARYWRRLSTEFDLIFHIRNFKGVRPYKFSNCHCSPVIQRPLNRKAD